MADNNTSAPVDTGPPPWEINWNDKAEAAKDASNQTPASLGTLVTAAASPWEQDFGGKRPYEAIPQPTMSPMTPQASVTQPTSFNQVFANVINTETGGKHVDASGNLITSSAGAQGISQVMKKTGENPGYGITPIQNNSAEEYLRFGRDYLGAMLKNFNGDWEKAVASYNAGPATVAKAVKKSTQVAGGDWKKFLPAETQKYIKKVLG